MKFTEILLKIDISIQILLMGTMLASLILAAVQLDGEMLGGYMIGEFFIGLWQIFSALIWGIYYSDKTRWKYLGYVALYFVSLMMFARMGYFASTLADIMVFIVPIPFALWYIFQTYNDIYKIQNYPRSFWDLT